MEDPPWQDSIVLERQYQRNESMKKNHIIALNRHSPVGIIPTPCNQYSSNANDP